MIEEKINDFYPSSFLTTSTNKATIADPQGDKTLLIQWGSTSITLSSSGSKFGRYGSVNVTFPTAFLSTPRGFANINDAAGYWNAGVSSVTTTGLTISVAGDSTSTKTVYWLAIGWAP